VGIVKEDRDDAQADPSIAQHVVLPPGWNRTRKRIPGQGQLIDLLQSYISHVMLQIRLWVMGLNEGRCQCSAMGNVWFYSCLTNAHQQLFNQIGGWEEIAASFGGWQS
jgi:hypothetical protein